MYNDTTLICCAVDDLLFPTRWCSCALELFIRCRLSAPYAIWRSTQRPAMSPQGSGDLADTIQAFTRVPILPVMVSPLASISSSIRFEQLTKMRPRQSTWGENRFCVFPSIYRGTTLTKRIRACSVDKISLNENLIFKTCVPPNTTNAAARYYHPHLRWIDLILHCVRSIRIISCVSQSF